MIRTTRAQREAIHHLFCRSVMDASPHPPAPLPEAISTLGWRAYRRYRRTLEGTFGMNGAVVIPFAGMFVCIERDGFRHT